MIAIAAAGTAAAAHLAAYDGMRVAVPPLRKSREATEYRKDREAQDVISRNQQRKTGGTARVLVAAVAMVVGVVAGAFCEVALIVRGPETTGKRRAPREGIDKGQIMATIRMGQRVSMPYSRVQADVIRVTQFTAR